MSTRRALSLHARLSVLLSVLLALSLLAGGALWLRETRQAIHEEIESAGHVAEQWLTVLLEHTRHDPEHGQARLLSALQDVGRLRAHALEITALDHTEPHYVSPAPLYKADRAAPAWFARHLEPAVRTRHFDAGPVQITLRPDASRSILDAWDHLSSRAGWGLAAVIACWLAAHAVLRRVLAPLQHISAAFARGAAGHFDRRLLHNGLPELDQLVASYNQLAERLDHSLQDHAQVAAEWAADQGFNRALQARLEEERQGIARELHDELAQGITAVRAIAGAIQQRSTDLPHIHSHAQAILAMTSHMQDGVRDILQRLRPLPTDVATLPAHTLSQVLQQHCQQWATLYPQIQLNWSQHGDCDDTLPALAHTVLRLLQECLTNVARHAGATQVAVCLSADTSQLTLSVRDNGRGLPSGLRPDGTRNASGLRFGLTGMQERVSALAGQLSFESAPDGGLCVRACLPRQPALKRTQLVEDYAHDTA